MTEAEHELNDNLHSLLGMAEMEWAVAIIADHARQAEVPFQQVAIKPEWFDERELHGFIHLCLGGWIEAGYPNSVFCATKGLTAKVAARLPWCGPVSDETVMDRFFRRFMP